jgi:hypothetical protein
MSQENVTVLPDDAWVLLLSTVRYSMGRRTYMTELAPTLVLRYATALTDDRLRQIGSEVNEALTRALSMGGTLGSVEDHKLWGKFVVDVHMLIGARNAEGTP